MRQCGNVLYNRTDHKGQYSTGHSSWITKATNMHSEYVTGLLIALPLQQWLLERASVLGYT